MAISFLTLNEFKSIATIPSTFIDNLETLQSGWTLKQLELITADIVSRLDKRYGPWTSPYPLKCQQWARDKCQVACLLRRGVDPNDQQFQEYSRLSSQADTEIKEAANASEGLFELPLRSDTTECGISKGMPRVYSETSPFVWMSIQRETGVQEDSSDTGTT